MGGGGSAPEERGLEVEGHRERRVGLSHSFSLISNIYVSLRFEMSCITG